MTHPIESKPLSELAASGIMPPSAHIRIRRPDNCSLVECPALSSYEREMQRREALEESMSKTLAREDALLRRNKMLGAEFEHRMLNSIQMVASILNVQSRIVNNKEAAGLLKEASQRLVAVGRIQRRLHASEPDSAVELRGYLEALVDDIAKMMRGNECAIHVDGEAVAVTPPTCTTAGLIVSELITNAMKHAPGKISVHVTQLDEGRCRVSVADEGVGLPTNFFTRPRTGMGLTIIEALVKQISGQIEWGAGVDGNGARIAVIFPTNTTSSNGEPAAGSEQCSYAS